MPEHRYAFSPGWMVALHDMGVDPDHVLKRAGIHRDPDMQDTQWVSSEQYFALWADLVDRFGDDTPLLICQSVSAMSFDSVLFAGLCSPNLEVAMQRIAACKRLVGPMSLQSRRVEDTVRVTVAWPAPLDPPPLLCVFETMVWVAFARLGLREDVAPQRITSPHAEHFSPAAQEYLGCPVLPGVDSLMWWDNDVSAQPFVTHNSAMWQVFEAQFRKRLDEMATEAPWSDRTRASLLVLLPVGRSGVADVGDHLTVSARTLQRHLRSEGTTFQEILSRVRHDLAEYYLAQGTLNVEEISFLLGYEETRSFYRAYQTWTGTTPRVRAYVTA